MEQQKRFCVQNKALFSLKQKAFPLAGWAEVEGGWKSGPLGLEQRPKERRFQAREARKAGVKAGGGPAVRGPGPWCFWERGGSREAQPGGAALPSSAQTAAKPERRRSPKRCRINSAEGDRPPFLLKSPKLNYESPAFS